MPRSRAANTDDPLRPLVRRGVRALVKAVRDGKPLGPAARALAVDMLFQVVAEDVATLRKKAPRVAEGVVAQLLGRRRRRRRRTVNDAPTSTHPDTDDELAEIARLKRQIDEGQP